MKAKIQKVAAPRRYLRGPAKSDRLDALTLAKIPFIDPEQLIEIYLPPAADPLYIMFPRDHAPRFSTGLSITFTNAAINLWSVGFSG